MPGQSTRRTSGVQKIVWRAFVLPGVRLARTTCFPTSALRREDLPTLLEESVGFGPLMRHTRTSAGQ